MSELIRLTGVSEAGITEGTLSFLFRTIGNITLHDPDVRWRQYGVFTMECAAELGGIEAALILGNLSNRTGNYTPPTAALEILQEVCSEGDMWQALTIRAQYLLRQPNVASKPVVLKEALALARQAVELTEPSNTDLHADDGYGLDPPWRVLRDIANTLGDQASVLDAVMEGAMKYNDPEACELLAEATTVTLYSARWLELTTKAAMNGSNSASYALGKYWLEKTGWYPCSRNAPNSSGTNIGLDWLELAASKRSAQRAAVIYLTIGLVCHENGRTKLGKQYLEAGVEAIANNPESFRTHEEATKAVEHLRTTIKDWDSDMRPGTGVSWQFFQDTKAAQYLMAPRMPPSEQSRKSTWCDLFRSVRR